MDETPVLVDKRAGYHVVTLNRPSRLNSFNEAMHRALMAALTEAEADSACRAILLTGAGRGFCAGQDLGDRAVAPGQAVDLGESVERRYNPLIRRLTGLPLPVISTARLCARTSAS